MKIALALGTRPEIIKMASGVRELERREADFFMLHTGQHYSYNLDRVFFEQLKLPQAKYNLDFSKARRDLKHNPRVPLEEGIPKTIEWMKQVYGFK